MPHYRNGHRQRGIPTRIWVVAAALLVLAVAGVIIARQTYDRGLQPVSSNQTPQIFAVKPGSSVKEISGKLQDARLIRSAWAFQLYVQRKELSDKLQAGTYALSPSQGTPAIVNTMTKGKVATRLVTILPGRRIDQVRSDLINDGFAPEAVDVALDPITYGDLPVLLYKPAEVKTLEGLLWPDSYQRQSETDPQVIIRKSLLAMGQHLTPDVQAAFASHGLTTYQGLIIASTIEQEVGKPADQAQVAQVFLLRMKKGMMLGSDSTTKYGAIAAGRSPDLRYDSPYNTLKRTGLPPTPISTVSQNSLNAATHPAGTDWLFFVSGDDGTTHFSHTIEEHEALTQKYCTKLCGN